MNKKLIAIVAAHWEIYIPTFIICVGLIIRYFVNMDVDSEVTKKVMSMPVTLLNNSYNEKVESNVNKYNLIGYDNAKLFIKNHYGNIKNGASITCATKPINYSFIDCHYTDFGELSIKLTCVNGHYSNASEELCVIGNERLTVKPMWINGNNHVRIKDMITGLQTEYENLEYFRSINDIFGDKIRYFWKEEKLTREIILEERYRYTYDRKLIVR